MFNLFILFTALRFVPVDFKKYDVLVPLSNVSRKQGLEIFLLPQLTVPLESSRRHIDDSVESNDDSNVDNVKDKEMYSHDSLRASKHIYRAIRHKRHNSKLRIVGGSDVDIRMFPHQVAYGIDCGGAIIGTKWILTAAHCGSRAYIRSGSHYFLQGTLTSVEKNHVHPLWTSNDKLHPFDYDFQVLELETDLTFDKTTQPIQITNIQDFPTGALLTVTGWGHTKERGQYADILQAVHVPIVDMSVCQQVKFPYFRGGLTPRMFCAGYKEGKRDACQGDSGGPAIYEDRLVGMVSFGYGCATPGSYGVYSKVYVVKDWIQSVIQTKLL